jgi:MFS family permease
MAVPFDILAEFTPAHLRGKALMGIEFFWTAGTVFVNGMAWAMLAQTSWRWLVGVCSAPVLLAMISFPWMPESPHWLLSVGRPKEAVQILRRAAALNGRPQAIPANLLLVHRTQFPGTAPASRSGSRSSTASSGDANGSGTASPRRPVGSWDHMEETVAPAASAVSVHASHNPLVLLGKQFRRLSSLLFAIWFLTGRFRSTGGRASAVG